MPKVKICGITNFVDRFNAVISGADYLGFVFYSRSPRYVHPKDVQYMCVSMSPHVKKVGLFVDADPQEVRETAHFLSLDVLQFHGNESPEYCAAFKDRAVWKAIKVGSIADLTRIGNYSSVDAILLDANVQGQMGGTGQTFDWNLAKKAKVYGKPIVLAGGLNPSNVAQAISIVDPFCVDVSSGVEESKGKKSMEKMKAFIEAAKGRSN